MSSPEPSSSSERPFHRRMGGCCGRSIAPLDPSGPGKVHHQVQVRPEFEVEVLAVPCHPGDRLARQCGCRRVEGLERRDRSDVEPVDGASGESASQVGGESRNFGELGHESSVTGAGDIRHPFM